MYKVTKKLVYWFYKYINLYSSESNEILRCFDDSDNFGFMNVSEWYDCKLQLFGVIDKNGEKLVFIKYDELDEWKYCVVSDKNNNIFYIEFLDGLNVGDVIMYSYSRIDIIWVNGINYKGWD